MMKEKRKRERDVKGLELLPIEVIARRTGFSPLTVQRWIEKRYFAAVVYFPGRGRKAQEPRVPQWAYEKFLTDRTVRMQEVGT